MAKIINDNYELCVQFPVENQVDVTNALSIVLGISYEEAKILIPENNKLSIVYIGTYTKAQEIRSRLMSLVPDLLTYVFKTDKTEEYLEQKLGKIQNIEKEFDETDILSDSDYFESIDPKDELPSRSGYYFIKYKSAVIYVAFYDIDKNNFSIGGNNQLLDRITFWLKPI